MSLDPFTWAQTQWSGGDRIPDVSTHLGVSAAAALNSHSALNPLAPSVAAIVVRCPDGDRFQPERVQLTPEGGLDGDRWNIGKRQKGNQISVMNLSVAHSIANGQSVVFFGDNLFIDMDLSAANLPVGQTLGIGSAILRVSSELHTPCHLFKARFGESSFRRTAKDLRLRGLFLEVIGAGELSLGNAVQKLPVTVPQ